jgi:hypothetical protein
MSIHGMSLNLFRQKTDPGLVYQNYGVVVTCSIVEENFLKKRSRMNGVGQGGRQEVEDAGTASRQY